METRWRTGKDGRAVRLVFKPDLEGRTEGRKEAGRKREREAGEVWLDGILLHSPWGRPLHRISHQSSPRPPGWGQPWHPCHTPSVAVSLARGGEREDGFQSVAAWARPPLAPDPCHASWAQMRALHTRPPRWVARKEAGAAVENQEDTLGSGG